MSGFTSVLKKIGTVLLDAGQVATTVLGFPFLTQMLGGIKIGNTTVGAVAATATSDFNTLAGIASIFEAGIPTTGSGSARLAASVPAVQQTILAWAQSNLPGHSKVKDPALLSRGAADLMNGFVECMNALGE